MSKKGVSMRAFVAVFALLCVCIVSSSAAELSNAERISLEDQARRDAEKEGDEKFWALATFAGTTLVSPYISLGAIAGAWYYQPAPPAYRFKGQSPLAIEIYTYTYKSVYRRAAIRGVLIGALGGSTLYYLTRSGYGFTFVRSW